MRVLLALAALAGPAAAVEMPIACTVQPSRVVELSAPFAGVVAEVFVKPGDRVAAGDPVARLDTSIAAADAAVALRRARSEGPGVAARARLDAAEAKLAVMTRAVERRAISRLAHDEARLERDLAAAEVLRAREELELAQAEAARAELVVEKSLVRAPMAGVIGPELVDAGEGVERAAIATIYVVEPLRVEAFVPVTRLPELLSHGAPAATISGLTAVAVPLTLDFVSPQADLSSRTVSVHFTLDDPRVRPGYGCQITMGAG